MKHAIASGSLVNASRRDICLFAPPWVKTSFNVPCRENPNLFFPAGYTQQYAKTVIAANRLCHKCPLEVTCREWAIARPELDGVWGATTPRERQRIRSERRDDE